MEPIKAFVGHSFSEADASVVRAILSCLTRVAELQSNFSWEHAEHPEPSLVGSKVLALFQGKNLFIGICTAKESAVESYALTPAWYSKEKLVAKSSRVSVKASDWVIQEIGVAIGRNMKVILLVEEGVRQPGQLQDNLEYVTFSRAAPEKCFDRLQGMIAALIPPANVLGGTPAQQNTADPKPAESAQTPENEWWKPKADWKRADFDLSMAYAVLKKDEAALKTIDTAFRASAIGAKELERARWDALIEEERVVFHGEGSLAELKRISESFPDDPVILGSLARAYDEYEEWGAATTAFQRAAQNEANAGTRISYLQAAALASYKEGKSDFTRALSDDAREVREGDSQTESTFLYGFARLAKEMKDDHLYVASLERLLELNPGDSGRGFDVAYKYSNMDIESLAALHYARIPDSKRSAATWNNLGVSYERLGLPVKSVSSYREAEKRGETLAMSNLASSLLNVGFLSEAMEMLNRAAEIKDHHKNVDQNIARAKEVLESEEKKEGELFERAKSIRDFYRKLGSALASSRHTDLATRWKSPETTLTVTRANEEVTMDGTYEIAGLGNLLSGLTSGASALRQKVEIRAKVFGRGMVGSISRRREGAAPPSLLSDEVPPTLLLLWVEEGGTRIHALEYVAKDNPRFYILERQGTD